MNPDRRIRIGNQTAVSASHPAEPFEYAVAHEFDAFEWFPDNSADGRGWSETDVPAATRALIRRVAEHHDIALSVHGSLGATPFSASGREQLVSQADFAAEIGAVIFVLHASTAEGFDRFRDEVGPLAARLARSGIRLAVENTPDTSPRDMNELLGCVPGRERRADDLAMCLDLGHANLCAETRNDYLGYVDRLAPDMPIAHLHLHENWGDSDAHLTLFTGPAARDGGGVQGLVSRLAARAFAGCIILEQWPQPPQLLDAARSRLLDLLTRP